MYSFTYLCIIYRHVKIYINYKTLLFSISKSNDNNMCSLYSLLVRMENCKILLRSLRVILYWEKKYPGEVWPFNDLYANKI